MYIIRYVTDVTLKYKGRSSEVGEISKLHRLVINEPSETMLFEVIFRYCLILWLFHF